VGGAKSESAAASQGGIPQLMRAPALSWATMSLVWAHGRCLLHATVRDLTLLDVVPSARLLAGAFSYPGCSVLALQAMDGILTQACGVLSRCGDGGAVLLVAEVGTSPEERLAWSQPEERPVSRGDQLLHPSEGVVGYVELWTPAFLEGKSIRGWSLEAPCAHVSSLAVSRAARRRGVATELMLEVERQARERGLDSITLQVEESNVASLSLCEQLGYVVVGRDEAASFGGAQYEARLALRKALDEQTQARRTVKTETCSGPCRGSSV